jgi:DNA processing protein
MPESTLSDADIARLAWLGIRNVGPKAVLKSFSRDLDLGSSAYVLEQLAPAAPAAEREGALSEAYNQLFLSHQEGIRILAYGDLEYPAPLKLLDDAPPFIWTKGELPRDWQSAVAVIGTREPNAYAEQMTQKLVHELASHRETLIVSGLALGVDSIAHKAALHEQLRTVAVLANGLDSIYPKANAKLAKDILGAGGLLLSETPTGRGVSKFNLVARDRLQSGLSLATFLMQSSYAGGSMHTALFTLQQKRTLIALKPLDREAEWSGNWFLFGRGAEEWTKERQNLKKITTYERPWALPLFEESMKEFVARGLESSFVPRQKTQDPENLSLL